MCRHTLPVCIYTTYVWVPAETHFSLRELFSFIRPLRDLQYSHRLLTQYEILVSLESHVETLDLKSTLCMAFQ